MYEAKQRKERVYHTLSTKKTVKQGIDDNMKSSVLQKNHVQENNSHSLQLIRKSDLKNDMGNEFRSKHIAEGRDLPSMLTKDDQANILEAIYYHRDKNDRKAKHTILFCESTNLCSSLLGSIGDTDDVSYSKQYVSEEEYPAITVLRSYNELNNRYSKAEFEHGKAKVKAMVKQEDGIPCFDHLVGTEPKNLPNKINLID